MKIIDHYKLLPTYFRRRNFNNENDIRIWFHISYKKEVKEVTYLIQNKVFNKPSNSNSDDNKEFIEMNKIHNSLLLKKEKKGEIIRTWISTDFQIKSFGHLATHITEVISSDPRFLLLWMYNGNIKMNINVYSKFKFVFNNFNDFKNKYPNPNLNLKSKEFWILFLSIFPSKYKDANKEVIENKPIKGFGQKSLEKLLINFNEESAIEILKIDKKILEKRKENVMNLVREIA